MSDLMPKQSKGGAWLPGIVILVEFLVCLPGAFAGGFEASWQDRFLTVRGDFPGGEIDIHYLEAYCQAGSSDRDWKETVIPHSSKRLASANPQTIIVEDRLADGVVVTHEIIVRSDGLDFTVTAHNPTDHPSSADWAQPCVRIDRFTGHDPVTSRELIPAYIKQCFVAIDGKLTWLPTRPWATTGRYTPGQVYCPTLVPRTDVNPRPLSSLVPSHGLCGCVSADRSWIMGVVWEPYQEVFQGVVTCIHTDFRIGGLAAGQTRMIRGRLYLLEGDQTALLDAYRRDFPHRALGLTASDDHQQSAAEPRADASRILSVSLDSIRAVGNEGHGNLAAATAWRHVAAAPPESIPMILMAIGGASPLAANWLRSAVDAIAGEGVTLPLSALEDFLADIKHDPRARRLAWELIRSRDSSRAERLIGDMLDDPSVELRHDAVARLMAAASLPSVAAETATATLRRALDAARDIDQIKMITTRLKKAGVDVDLQRQFGFLAQWHVIGPFDNTNGAGFEAVYPPEETITLDGIYPGKQGETHWKPFVTTDPYGLVDINRAFPGPGDGLKEVVAYAWTSYTAAEARDAEIRLGCKNAWKVWHNEILVFGRDEYHRGMRIDQYRLPIRLTAGPNTFLIKLCQDGQTKDWTKQWQFQLRICDAAGTALLAPDRPPTPRDIEPSRSDAASEDDDP